MYAPGQVAFELLDRWTCDGTSDPGSSPSRSWDVSEWTSLPSAVDTDMSVLLRSMGERTAIRHYAPGPVALAELAALLRAACDVDRLCFSDHPAAMAVLIWAARIDDLEPGLYLYDPASNAAGRLGALDSTESMFLQDEFEACAGVILTVADLSVYLLRYGAHGYRLCLTRGGALSNAAWLASGPQGIAGSLFAGFIPAALRTAVDIDGLTRLPCLAYGFGRRPMWVAAGGEAQ